MTRLLSALLAAAMFASVAHLALAQPDPVNPPDWWVHPPGDTTRLQYHSFATNPDLNLQPDYTENGFTPATLPSPPYPQGVIDKWTLDTGTQLNTVLDPALRPDPALGDGTVALVPADGDFIKAMGNATLLPVKEYFYQIVWSTPLFLSGGPQPINVPSLDLTAPNATVTGDGGGLLKTERVGDWWITTWQGEIRPQPEYEVFDVNFFEDTYVDSVWVGTHCVPEPGTGLLAACGLGVAFIRRRPR